MMLVTSQVRSPGLRNRKGELVEVTAAEDEDVPVDYLAEHHLIPEQ
jgi:hypothetical protein